MMIQGRNGNGMTQTIKCIWKEDGFRGFYRGFNASLMSEMRAIDFVQRLLEGGRLEQPRYRRIFLHSIEDEVHMREFKLSTKFNGDWDFLQTLRRYGHAAADRFLSTSADAIGKDSSLDIQRYL